MIYIVNYKFKKCFLHIYFYTVLFVSNNNVELMVWKILFDYFLINIFFIK